jgi:hypothetical protein
MQTLETTDAKVARRCRYDQHRFQKTTLTIRGSLVTGLVRSVLEIKSSNSTRWILTIIAEPDMAVDLDHAAGEFVGRKQKCASHPAGARSKISAPRHREVRDRARMIRMLP